MSARTGAIRTATLFGILTLAAAALAAENPAPDEEDPLPVDSTWKGKFTQLGVHPDASFPPEVEATLTVTARDGDRVGLELRETCGGMDVTFLCRGRLARGADKRLSLEFKSFEVKGVPNAGVYLLDVPYTATIAGDTIKGAWKYADKAEGIDLGGEYALTRE